MPQDNRKIVYSFLCLYVFVSGGVALILQQVYEKFLSTLIGVTTPAASVVLAVYFLGLTLGAWFCPRPKKNAATQLAVLELFVAVWALSVGLFFYESYEYLASILQITSGSEFKVVLGRAFVSALWILPPTIAMGASFPSLVALLERYGYQEGKSITQMYSLNLLGACAFTLACPFLFFDLLGLRGSCWIAAGLGFLFAILVFLIPRHVKPKHDAVAELPKDETNEGAKVAIRGMNGQTVFLAFFSGYIFFALEVVWFHLISSSLGSSTYSFSILLGIVLLSLASGGMAVKKAKLESNTEVAKYLANIFVLLIIVFPLSNAVWPYLGKVLAVCGSIWEIESFWVGESLKFLLVFLSIFPVAKLIGCIFPILLKGATLGFSPNCRQVGMLSAINSMGCISGALTTGFFSINLLGSENLLKFFWILAALCLVLVCVLNKEFSSHDRVKKLVPTGIFGVFVLVFLPGWNRLELTSGYGVYFARSIPEGSELVMFYEDSYTGFTTVVKGEDKNGFLGKDTKLTLLNNGKFDANDAEEMIAQVTCSLAPVLHTTRQDNCLVIGLGSGQTASIPSVMGFKNQQTQCLQTH